MNTQTANTNAADTLADLLWDAVAAATLGQIERKYRRDLDQAIVGLRIATRDGDAAEAEDAMATLAAIGADTSKIAPIVDRMIKGR